MVISGFKRLLAAERLGIGKVPSIVVDVDERRAVLMAIHENLRRGLNAVEKGHALSLMIQAGFDWSHVSRVMHMLSIDPSEKMLALFLKLSRAEDEVKAFISSRQITKKSMEILLSFEDAERINIVRMLSKLRLTGASLFEILTLLMLLKARVGQITSSHLPSKKDASEFKAELKRMVNPGLSELERALRERMGNVSFPPGMKIIFDPFFEKDYIEISIRVKSLQDLDLASQILKKNRAAMEGILELTGALC